MICTQKGVKSGQIQRNPTPWKFHGDRDKYPPTIERIKIKHSESDYWR
jgi:hypothetical protein